jgi:hypothetical protein
LPQAGDTPFEFRILARLVALQGIATGPGVGVDIPPGLVLAIEVAQQFDQHEMLEDVGVIAGVKGVAVTEHERSEAGARQRC